MQLIYKNETSLVLRWVILAAGVVLLALCAADYFAIWPVFNVNQNLDLALLLVGSALTIIGFKEVSGFVNEVSVDDARNVMVVHGFGTATLPGSSIRSLTIYASGKDARRLTLSSDSGSFTFPSKVFPADRIAETIKAINPAATIVRRA